MRTIVFFVLLASAATASAQIYRWTDAQGRVNFSNTAPPQGVKSTIIDPDAKEGPPSVESTECYSIRCQGERMEERQRRRDAEDARLNTERAAAAPKVRGLDFRDYLRIRRGMSEGELLSIAGEPDLKTDQGGAFAAPSTIQVDRNLSVAAVQGMRTVTWTYLPTPGDPFITDSLGWVEFRMGNRAEALRILQAAYKDRPDPEIAAHLGEVLWSLGQRDQAQTVWREGLLINAENDTLQETLQRLKVKP